MAKKKAKKKRKTAEKARKPQPSRAGDGPPSRPPKELPRLSGEESHGYIAYLGSIAAGDAWNLLGRGVGNMQDYFHKLGEIDCPHRSDKVNKVILIALDSDGSRGIDPTAWVALRAEDCWLLTDDLKATLREEPGAGFVAIRDSVTVAALDSVYPEARKVRRLEAPGERPTGGLVPPNLLSWHGATVELPSKQWRILDFMWECDRAKLEELVDHVWGHDADVGDAVVRTALSRLSTLLLEKQVALGWELHMKSGYIVKASS